MPTLSYDANNAYLNFVKFAAAEQPQRQPANVADCRTTYSTRRRLPVVLGTLTPAGVTQASGESATGSQQTTFDAMNLFLGRDRSLYRSAAPAPGGGSSGYVSEGDASAYASDGRRRTSAERDAYAMFTKAPPCAAFDPRWSVWAAGFGGSQTTDGNAALGSNNTTSSVYGTAVGADYRISPSTVAGFALAGGGTNFNVEGRAAAAPICSRPAPLSGTLSGLPMSRLRWPMAGRTSPPTAPSPSPAPINCARSSTPMRSPAVSRAAIVL